MFTFVQAFTSCLFSTVKDKACIEIKVETRRIHAHICLCSSQAPNIKYCWQNEKQRMTHPFFPWSCFIFLLLGKCCQKINPLFRPLCVNVCVCERERAVVELQVFVLHDNSNTSEKKLFFLGFVYTFKEFLCHCNWMYAAWFSYCIAAETIIKAL